MNGKEEAGCETAHGSRLTAHGSRLTAHGSLYALALSCLVGELLITGWSYACPTPNAATYNDYIPGKVLEVAPSSSTCTSSSASMCGDAIVVLPGDEYGVADPNNPHLLPPLFVWLPGTDEEPRDHKHILQMAAFAGFRTVGLSYHNTNEIITQCLGIESSNACEVDYDDECPYEVRWERMSGQEDVHTTQYVHYQDSIAYRLLEVLVALETWDTGDAWGFEDYCVGSCSLSVGAPWTDGIDWSDIVLAGFSQGAGYPQLLSLETQVEGIVCIDGGNDRCGTIGSSTVASYLPDLEGSGGGASPGNGEFAAIHDDNDFEGMDSGEEVPDAFAYVQLHTTVHDIDANGLPLTQNVVWTGQNWSTTCGSHTSMVVEGCMPTHATYNEFDPTDVDSSTYPPDLHLFKAYVEGFCDAYAL